mmetsp:Transcript_33030/g.53199  ORF Transcript_33030/g.53199 Transcript_33030/m.53199 type:complete len:201 (+) Transcript_33030:427-1029(+)
MERTGNTTTIHRCEISQHCLCRTCAGCALPLSKQTTTEAVHSTRTSSWTHSCLFWVWTWATCICSSCGLTLTVTAQSLGKSFCPTCCPRTKESSRLQLKARGSSWTMHNFPIMLCRSTGTKTQLGDCFTSRRRIAMCPSAARERCFCGVQTAWILSRKVPIPVNSKPTCRLSHNLCTLKDSRTPTAWRYARQTNSSFSST